MEPILDPKENMQKLLRDAQEKKKTDIEEAINLLFKAEHLLLQMPSDADKQSERNIVQGKANNKDILYFSKRGYILYELKEYEKAAFCYQVVKDSLFSPPAYKAYGDCLRKLSHYNIAIKQYEKGLKTDQKLDSPAPTVTAGLWNSKGLVYLGLKKYQEALENFEEAIKICSDNPLYHCNSGHAAYALGEKQKAFGYFEKASKLIDSTQKGILTKDNILYIRDKTQKFIQELEKFDALSLSIKDSIMDARGQQYREKGIEALSAPINAQKGTEEEISDIIDQGSQIIETKEKLKLIKEDPILNEYYDGFMFTLHQSYASAAIVLSRKVEIKKSGNTLTNTIINLISLVPGIGTQLSKGAKALQEFLESTEIFKCAANVCSFETTQADFDSIAQDVLCEVILEKKTELNALSSADLSEQKLSDWASRFKSLAESIGESKDKLVESLYGERNKTPLQKLGYQTATILVSDHLASGDIYQGVAAVQISSSEKRTRLTDIVHKVIKQILTKP